MFQFQRLLAALRAIIGSWILWKTRAERFDPITFLRFSRYVTYLDDASWNKLVDREHQEVYQLPLRKKHPFPSSYYQSALGVSDRELPGSL